MSQQLQNIRVQRLLLVISVTLFLLKIIAWYITGSVAILTDALESIVNMVAAAMGLYSLILSSKPKDANHPYGHGKVEYISSAIEGTLICIAGILIVYESISNFFTGHELKQLDAGLYIVAASAAVNYLVGWYAVKTGNKNKSYPLIAAGKHLQSDTYSTIGIVIGILLILLTGRLWLDSAVALLFAGIIIYTGMRIIKQSLAGIMDEADFILLGELIEYANNHRRENWIDLHNLRIIKYGSILHIDCHLTVPWFLNVRQAHQEIEWFTEMIRNKYGESVEFFIHTDGCEDFSCSLCTKESCPERKSAFREKLIWNLQRVVSDKKHRM